MSSPRYFQGNSVTGPVRASDATTFRDVVDLFRIAPTLGITRAAFLALDKPKRNEVKHVPFFVPACFKSSPSKRVYAEATHCNLIFLDLDEHKDGSCPAAPFCKDPEALYQALDGFNFAAYTTASSTPQKPRMRVVVDADQIPLKSYSKAVATIAAMLGVDRITTESKVSVQPMFLPTLFSDSGDDDPLIAYKFDSRAFTEEDISGSDYPEYTEPKHTHGKNGDSGIDALEFLRAPIPEITLSIAAEALDRIDPDCSYFEWLECAAGLKHQFSPSKAEEAFALFNKWSEGGGKYPGEDKTRSKWDSLRPTPVGRVPVTIRTLLHHAVVAGWDDKKVKETSFSNLMRWLDEGAGSITELMDKGVQKLLAAPLLSSMQEDTLVHHLCRVAKSRFAYSLSTTAVRKDIARIRAEIKEQQKPPAEKLREPKWAKGVCYISAVQDFYRQRTGERYKAESFNSTYSRWLLPTEESLKDAGIPITPATLSKPIVSPSDYALNHLKILTVYDYAYDPSQPTAMIFVSRGRKYVNTYSPSYPELDPKRAPEAGKIFQNHLQNLVAEEDYRRILTDFMAYMVQSPGRKITWATLLQGAEGCGKTFLAECMKAVLGFEHVKKISGDTIKKGWNEWAFGYQLVIIEEIRVAGVNKYEVMNALKEPVTNSSIPINQRNRDTREVTNISNYMMFSNHHDALALTPNDRRYFVVKSQLQSKAQVLNLGENYFNKLFGMLRDMPGALRAYLSDWEISPEFEPFGHAPRTTYVSEVINDSASDLTAAVRRLLLEADYPLVQYDIVSSKQLMDVLHLEEGLARCSSQQVGQVLREEGYKQIGRCLLGSERHYFWVRSGVDEKSALDVAAGRLAAGEKNLAMDLIYE